MTSNSAIGDMTTVLRHLVENTQWGGNQGAKSETMEALDRLTSDKYGDKEDNSETPTTDPTVAEPDVSGGSRPTSQRSSRAK